MICVRVLFSGIMLFFQVFGCSTYYFSSYLVSVHFVWLLTSNYRVHMGHGQTGKSCNFRTSFPGLESHGSKVLVMENHGNCTKFIQHFLFLNEIARREN